MINPTELSSLTVDQLKELLEVKENEQLNVKRKRREDVLVEIDKAEAEIYELDQLIGETRPFLPPSLQGTRKGRPPGSKTMHGRNILKIIEALRSGPKTSREISELTGIPARQVATVVLRNIRDKSIKRVINPNNSTFSYIYELSEGLEARLAAADKGARQ